MATSNNQLQVQLSHKTREFQECQEKLKEAEQKLGAALLRNQELIYQIRDFQDRFSGCHPHSETPPIRKAKEDSGSGEILSLPAQRESEPPDDNEKGWKELYEEKNEEFLKQAETIDTLNWQLNEKQKANDWQASMIERLNRQVSECNALITHQSSQITDLQVKLEEKEKANKWLGEKASMLDKSLSTLKEWLNKILKTDLDTFCIDDKYIDNYVESVETLNERLIEKGREQYRAVEDLCEARNEWKTHYSRLQASANKNGELVAELKKHIHSLEEGLKGSAERKKILQDYLLEITGLDFAPGVEYYAFEKWKESRNVQSTESKIEVNLDFKSALQMQVDEIRDMLLQKNKSYGNSALEPARVFSRMNAREGLLVRIDDKLSRIQRGERYPGDNDLNDLIGYLFLLKIANQMADDEE